MGRGCGEILTKDFVCTDFFYAIVPAHMRMCTARFETTVCHKILDVRDYRHTHTYRISARKPACSGYGKYLVLYLLVLLHEDFRKSRTSSRYGQHGRG